MTTLLGSAVAFAITCLVLSMLCCGVRLLVGPSAADRVLALDTLWLCGMLLLLLLGIRYGSTLVFDAALLMTLVGFASTLALAKFLARGEVIR
jgi:multicomponent K+:H+ antiporter subunit F